MAKKVAPLTISTQGIQGGTHSTKLVIYADIDSHKDKFSISVDSYEGQGSSFKEREHSKILIHFPNGERRVFQSIEELQKSLKKEKTK